VAYKKDISKIKAPGQTHPVIVLYDNDSGASSIKSAVKEASSKVKNVNTPLGQVIGNLYALATPPLPGSQESRIEDFFDAELKATVLEGKTFNDKNDFDTPTHYGKKVFAHRVVRAKAESANFDGFHPLLTDLASIIKAHQPATSPE
jgi:hypothetical protein